MTPLDESAPVRPAILALQRLLDRFGDRGVIIGGVAVSVLAQPRFTADADALLLLDIEELPEVIEAAAQEGLMPRRDDVEEFARLHRIVLLQHEASDTNVDISLGALPFEIEAVERAGFHQTGSVRLRLPTPEDLIIMKAVAHRPKDLEDIRAVIETYPTLVLQPQIGAALIGTQRRRR